MVWGAMSAAEKHSLYYIYTALSKPVDLPSIYEFTAMGLLDDRQIDYYNSKEKIKIPKQTWMKEKMQEDYWEKGTQSRKRKEQWFNVNVNILMNRMRQNESDLHVLQWRHGCEVEQQGDKVTFLRGVSEYGYDGENFLSFDDKESQWVAPVPAARPTKNKWDNVPILNQYTKGYLEKECVDWLNKFREYADEELRNGSPPDVHVFSRKSSDESKLKLTCLATGFFPKDVMMTIRKNGIFLPEDEITFSGIRPNHDGSFQMRKSVEIKEDEKAEYDCFVSHKSIKEPTITKLGQATLNVKTTNPKERKKESDGQESAGQTPDISATVSLEKVKQSANKHSLYYIYTALSKPVDLPSIYEFTAMGLLDDRQIDYYNSKDKIKIPKQTWMKEKMQEDYWEKGTQSRKRKEQWFNVNVNILMNRMRQNESDLHVLQWRHGCEVEQQGDKVTFLRGVSEYGYDGEDFLSFEDKESLWVAPVEAARPTKTKWDNVPILNQYTKGYLEKECVDWLNKFREYADEELRNGSPPDVHVFSRKSSDESKLKLTCLATGFFPKDVMMTIRKNGIFLPEDEIKFSGIRPNHDGSFQMRKSVEIKEDEKAEYDCFVFHKSIKEPTITKLGQATLNVKTTNPKERKKESDGQESAGQTPDISATVSLEKVKQSANKHSLYYIYTALSKPVDLPGIYEFTAMGLLDDRQIDYYNSKDKIKIPKQTWMKEKMQEDYWEKGTQSRKSKEQWFNVNVNILMNRMRQNESDLHVLQWRVGCEVEQQGDKVTFLRGISEYGYDGENFLAFDDKESLWVAPVEAARPTKTKWDNVPILNQYTKGYLEKECVDWLNKFKEYADEELRNGSPPDVHVFSRKSSDESKLKLTCLATGFFPKDVMMTIRKNGIFLPEDEIKFSGIRPNHDGSFQMRKSVEIKEDEKAEYDCFVSHKSIKEPTITKLGQATLNVKTTNAEERKKESDGQESAGQTPDISATVSLEKVKQSANKHSLYYIYTALSKPVDLPGIYEFTAMGLLDDRQIDYYNSKDKIKIPKQTWMKEKMQEDYWEKGTQSRRSKEQWFNVNVNILMNRMRQNESDLHVLQWRVGCEVEQQGDKVTFLRGVSEYGYDGENFLSFDDKESLWVAPVEAARPTKTKWDNVPILNQYTKGYLEKECVDWLNKFREYADEELRNGSPPDVHVFSRKSSDESKLKLTCLATGFFPKDVMMTIRKNGTFLPEDEIKFSGIRPNHDGSFQMRKSVELKEDEKAEYDCFVFHKSIKQPIITK
ncbi:uncharacterized protein [Pseudorasbora parva]|uniref:uncharacterized protein isoform X2 n=1 Tax=Pseudorasbora parva TaxID=51549 RepID=UPI00351F55D3